MAAFPSTPTPTWTYSIEPQWRTLVTEFDSGEEQRRQKWLYSKYNVKLSFSGLSATAAGNIYEFYQARKGSYEAFHFFDYYSSTHSNVYVGTGDSTSLSFDIPGKQTSSRKIYLNGNETTAVAYTTAAGTDGSDLVTFTGAPTSTQIITTDFAGLLRIRCRFADDNLSKDNFVTQLFSYGIVLKGLAPA
jgi:uncharacterized protein (TIGR02217 family)